MRHTCSFAIVMLALALTGCGGSESQKDKPAKNGGSPRAAALNVLIFSEYIDPEIVEVFKKQHNCTVNLAYYESTEEMQAKLQHGGGASQFDVVVAPNNTLAMMVRQSLVQPVDAAKIPNLANLNERFAKMSVVNGKTYGAAYQWGTVGLMYNKKKLANFEASWAALFDEAKQPARFTLSGDMRDQLGAALRFLGQSVNSTDAVQIRKAGELVIAAKVKSKGMLDGVEGKNEVAAGNVDLAVVWNGDALRAIAEDKKDELDFAVPKEGSVIWADLMLVPAKAPNAELAHQFINHILDGKTGAKLSNYNKYATPNKASLPDIEKEDRENPNLYPPAAIMEKLEYLADLGASEKLYQDAWTAVKAK